MTRVLNSEGDSLDDLIGARTDAPKPAVTPPANYKPADFSEPCKKCRGSGNFVGRNGRVFGPCFVCKGAGKLTFKTSPERRATNSAGRAAALAAKIEAFKVAHADVWAWMDGSTFGPAIEMREALEKYGDLFESRIEAARRMIAQRDAARATRVAADAERTAAAPAVDTAGIDRLKQAFDTAIAFSATKGHGVRLRNPRITIGGVTISPAKATSKNPGALYVKSGETYLGKIVGGKLIVSNECAPDQQAQVLEFIADPAAAAKAYGQETGVCCVCNAVLKSKWRLRGIGPICAQKFGW